MGRKTRILTRINKFSIKFANHPLLKNKEQNDVSVSSLVEEFQEIIKEEVHSTFEKTIDPEIETTVEEPVEIKKPTFSKKAVKTKK